VSEWLRGVSPHSRLGVCRQHSAGLNPPRVSVPSSASRAAERRHPTGRQRMASPTLQTLQNPILLPPSVLLSRLGGFPHPCGRNLPHLEARVVPGVHHAVVHTQRLRLEVVPRASALRPPARGAYGSPQRRVHLPRQHNQSQCYAQLPRTPSPLPSGQERTLRLAVRSLPRAHTLHPLPTHSRPCSHARTHLVPAGGGEAVQQLPLPPRSELVARHWAVRTGERGTTKRARNAVATNHNPLQSPIISSTRFWPDAGRSAHPER
jgi:hypothetical protein